MEELRVSDLKDYSGKTIFATGAVRNVNGDKGRCDLLPMAALLRVSHHMEEVERLCDRAILLKDGQSEAYGTISDIKKEFGCTSMDDVFVKVYGGEATEGGDE